MKIQANFLKHLKNISEYYLISLEKIWSYRNIFYSEIKPEIKQSKKINKYYNKTERRIVINSSIITWKMKQRKTDEFYEEQLNSIVKIEKVEKSFGEKYHIQGIKSEKLKGVLERYDLDNEYEVSIFRLNGKMKEVLKNPKVSENFIEIMYCLNGECSFTSNFEKIKKIYKFNKGDIIIHRATNEIKEYEVESENLVLISIDVYLDEMIKDILEESNNRKAEEWKKKILNMFKVDEFYYGKCNEEIKILSEEINNTSVNNVGEYLTFKAKIFQFILLVLNIQFNSIETVEIIVQNAKEILEKYQIFELPTVGKLSKLMNISRYQLQAAFQEFEGIGIAKYIKRKKMNYAKEMLVNTNKSILEIASEVGYENPSKFSEVFKNYFGILPNKYRKIF
jgi:putative transcriptional regulatory protein